MVGTVWQLKPTKNGWVETNIYAFTSVNGTQYPYGGYPGGLAVDKRGNVYGITTWAGEYNIGNVFELTPSPDGTWQESTLYSFNPGIGDGSPLGNLIVDRKGNVYGVMANGTYGHGAVYMLTHTAGVWNRTVLYDFTGQTDGSGPESGLTFGPEESLLGTTAAGGDMSCGVQWPGGCGTVFQLNRASDSQWTETVLHSFSGCNSLGPQSQLISTGKGEFYGVTAGSGDAGCTGLGEVFSIRP